MVVPYHVGDPHVFVRDRVVRSHQRERRLVVEVLALPAHRLMGLGEPADRLPPARLPFFRLDTRRWHVARYRSALREQRGLWICAVGEGGEGLQAEIDPRLLGSRLQRVCRHLGTGDGDIPAVRLFRDSDGLGRALDGARPLYAEAPNLGEDERAVIQPCPVTVFFVGERAVAIAIAPFEAREAGLLAALYPPEERLLGLVQPRQHVLQHMAVDRGVLRILRPDGLQLGFLLVAREGDTASLPGGDALLQGRGVEGAAAPQDNLQCPLLGRSGPELLFLGCTTHRLVLVHVLLFQSSSATTAIQGTSGSSPTRLTAWGESQRLAAG